MDEIDLRALRLFVTALDEGSFSAGARALGLTQPTVSRTVAALEAKLGTSLVGRSTRRFEPTTAGWVLHREGRAALAQAEAALILTRRAAHDRGRIVVAVKADGDAGLLERALPSWEQDRAPVGLLFTDPANLAWAVRTGEADLCLVAGPVDLDGLESDVVLVEPRLAILPADHRLAAAAEIGLDDLVEEPVAAWPGLPAQLDRYYAGLRPDDPDRPGRRPEVSDLAEVVRLAELGRAITFLPTSSALRFGGRRIALVPVHDLEPSELRVAWRASSRDLVLASFIRHLQDSANLSDRPEPLRSA